MSEKAKPFYVVWREAGRQPVYKHSTYERALNEADRLSRQCPGEAFFVLVPLTKVQRETVTVTPFDISHLVDDDDVPF